MSPDLMGALSVTSQDAFRQDRVHQLESLVKEGELRKATQEFEAYFLSYLLKVMRETVPKNTLTQNQMGEVFQSFYDEAIGRQAAQAGGIGLGRLIESSLGSGQLDPVQAKGIVPSSSKVSTDNNRKER